ncbi:phosphomannomutase [Xanthomonas translucens pv. arrhenatheri]|jgi:phosphomannomutase/phosphoglucomutase|uniref:phosphomannomutase n=4 Tax=Xanthomonas translucens group TaxID=3390202 RepID=A0A0K2ZTX6_9XANT|nr:phosphoglucomutase/phosphomannomutase [Xanthomonas translucens]EKU26532.1 phosphoglucomutase / phosphomannomutase [Xanthomonas translucens pv. graminis ART-Xtg29]OAX62303.1 phosphomannomutase [Xanthomonas translucens pv. graminis]OAX64168.1 phosphomannomutase [Xanthomonas translucens pv. arrhenatheri]QDI04672.1 phosphomannomutase [Xanthomonas translucens pv. cerealis]UKE46684.1 phosphomannomutase [Xanthomonas translucens pv. cerealis]
MSLPAFKAYDIRGRVPDELNEDLARRIGVALAGQLESGPVVVGHDVRLASQGLQDALSAGLRASGREVIDIGLCGTEEVYFQTDHLQAAGGVMVTASHNPMDYNGMKLVRENARPISSDTGLFAIRDTVAADTAPAGTPTAAQHSRPDKSAYIAHLLSYIDIGSLKPLKLVVNAGNGGAGAIVDLLAPHLPFEFVRVFHEPDGHFPNGIPNPLLPENREATAKAVKQHGADFGIAWDGDFDRCFFFDENGRFIEGYYLVGLLAQAILAKQPGGKVVHDPRLTWNTIEMVEDAGGVPVLCKSGHAFIKEKMRSENAVYGGEMSAHHYFREFAYADSGMIPWLLIAELVSQSGRSLADLVEARMQKFPCSGEINFKVADAKAAVARVMQHYAAQSPALDDTDGVSAEFAQWRFNLRSSNTEPLLRLNVETRGDAALLEQRTQEISDLLRG